MKDLRSFNIPYCFGNLGKVMALVDSSAIINAMPFNLFQKLDLVDLRPTSKTL